MAMAIKCKPDNNGVVVVVQGDSQIRIQPEQWDVFLLELHKAKIKSSDNDAYTKERFSKKQ